jgi:hypothetical protein
MMSFGIDREGKSSARTGEEGVPMKSVETTRSVFFTETALILGSGH